MKFYGELLIFVLLLLTNLRVFFVKHVRRDPLVSLAPTSLLISILQIIAWGIDFFTLLALIISITVFLSNFHALFRYSEHLYIDHYSPLMKIWSIFTTIISAIAITSLLIFASVDKQSEKLNVAEDSTYYTGNFRTGFEPAGTFSKPSLIIHKYSPIEKSNAYVSLKGVILFVPDKRAESVNYKPYFQYLAREGYTVYSADFYADDGKWLHNWQDAKIFRRTAMVLHSLIDNQNFMSQREYYTYNIKQELQALGPIMEKECGYWKTYYIVSDVMANTAIADYYKENPEKIKGIFNLDSISEYKTPGYGCIEQTDPLLAAYFSLQRDVNYYTPILLAIKTREYFEKGIAKK